MNKKKTKSKKFYFMQLLNGYVISLYNSYGSSFSQNVNIFLIYTELRICAT